MSSLRRGHANLLCIVPILSDVSEETERCWSSGLISWSLRCWLRGMALNLQSVALVSLRLRSPPSPAGPHRAEAPAKSWACSSSAAQFSGGERAFLVDVLFFNFDAYIPDIYIYYICSQKKTDIVYSDTLTASSMHP